MEVDSIDPLARGFCQKPASAFDVEDILAFDEWSAQGKTHPTRTLNKIVEGSGEY